MAIIEVMSPLVMLVVQAVSRLAFDVALPRQVAGYVLGSVLSAVSMLAMGLLIAALVPPPPAAFLAKGTPGL